ncbi:MAG: hypothetical protein CL862_09595 [Cyanobium sp. NAT70]|nr:hypothetical protein [Cyanobium sp. NAT70]
MSDIEKLFSGVESGIVGGGRFVFCVGLRGDGISGGIGLAESVGFLGGSMPGGNGGQSGGYGGLMGKIGGF